MVNKMVGPAGHLAITVDAELTEKNRWTFVRPKEIDFMRKAKIASVGCGIVAKRWHLPTIAELTKRGDLDWIAVCDIDAAVAPRSR